MATDHISWPIPPYPWIVDHVTSMGGMYGEFPRSSWSVPPPILHERSRKSWRIPRESDHEFPTNSPGIPGSVHGDFTRDSPFQGVPSDFTFTCIYKYLVSSPSCKRGGQESITHKCVSRVCAPAIGSKRKAFEVVVTTEAWTSPLSFIEAPTGRFSTPYRLRHQLGGVYSEYWCASLLTLVIFSPRQREPCQIWNEIRLVNDAFRPTATSHS